MIVRRLKARREASLPKIVHPALLLLLLRALLLQLRWDLELLRWHATAAAAAELCQVLEASAPLLLLLLLLLLLHRWLASKHGRMRHLNTTAATLWAATMPPPLLLLLLLLWLLLLLLLLMLMLLAGKSLPLGAHELLWWPLWIGLVLAVRAAPVLLLLEVHRGRHLLQVRRRHLLLSRVRTAPSIWSSLLLGLLSLTTAVTILPWPLRGSGRAIAAAADPTVASGLTCAGTARSLICAAVVLGPFPNLPCLLCRCLGLVIGKLELL